MRNGSFPLLTRTNPPKLTALSSRPLPCLVGGSMQRSIQQHTTETGNGQQSTVRQESAAAPANVRARSRVSNQLVCRMIAVRARPSAATRPSGGLAPGSEKMWERVVERHDSLAISALAALPRPTLLYRVKIASLSLYGFPACDSHLWAHWPTGRVGIGGQSL